MHETISKMECRLIKSGSLLLDFFHVADQNICIDTVIIWNLSSFSANHPDTRAYPGVKLWVKPTGSLAAGGSALRSTGLRWSAAPKQGHHDDGASVERLRKVGAFAVAPVDKGSTWLMSEDDRKLKRHVVQHLNVFFFLWGTRDVFKRFIYKILMCI